MGVKVTGQFEPAGAFSIVDGKDVSGHITGSNISGSATGTGSFGKLLGDGSSLTGIAGYTVANSSNNRILTSVDSINANAEANLTFDGSTLGVTGDLNIGSGDFFVDDSTGHIGFGTTSPNISSITGRAMTLNAPAGGYAIFEFAENGARQGNINHYGDDLTIYNNVNGKLELGTNNSIRLSIAAGGDVTLTHDLAAANLSVAGNITHTDNATTKIAFDTNEVQMFSNNNERLKVADGVVNVIAMLSGSGEAEFRQNLLVDGNITGSSNLKIAGNISGSSTSTGSFAHVHIPDGTSGLGIGNDSDLLLYHNGNHSYIKDNGTGNLYVQGGTQTFQNAAANKTMMVLNAANSVDLHYNNSKKFETTNTGVSVTGGMVVSGDSIFQGSLTAKELIVSSSVLNVTQSFSSGSTIFGNSTDDTHLFTGSVNITGSATATSFIGDGSQLTGLTPASITTYNSAADNRIITSVNSTTVQGESNLTFDGSTLVVNGAIDLSGDIDVDGTLEADAITVNGSTLSSVIQGTTVNLASKVTINNDTTSNLAWPVVFHIRTGGIGTENALGDDTGVLTYTPGFQTLTVPKIAANLTGAVTADNNFTVTGQTGSFSNTLEVKKYRTVTNSTSNFGDIANFANGADAIASIESWNAHNASNAVARLSLKSSRSNNDTHYHIARGSYRSYTSNGNPALELVVGTALGYNITHGTSPRLTMDTSGNIDIHQNLEVLGNISGSSTSTGSFGKLLGDGSSLTGLSSFTVANSSNNRILTSVDSSNGNAEANLTFDGSTLGVTGAITSTTTGSFSRVEIGGGGSKAGWDTKLWLKGTTSAATTLHIESTNISAVSALRFETNGNDWYWAAGGSSQGYYPNKMYLYNESTGIAPITFTNDGKVGIGNNNRSPSYQLDNNGTFRTAGKAYFENFVSITPNWGRFGVGMDGFNDPQYTIHAKIPNGVGGNTVSSANLMNNNTMGIVVENANNAANTGMKLGFRSTGTYTGDTFIWHENTGTDGQGRMAFWTETGGTAYERMRIDHNGNIGIGTSSPNTPLHTYQATAGSKVAVFQTAASGHTQGITIGSGTNGSNGKGLHVGYGQGINSGYLDAYDWDGGAYQKLKINDYFTFNAQSGFGINQATPAYKLDVTGDGRFTTNLLVNGNISGSSSSTGSFSSLRVDSFDFVGTHANQDSTIVLGNGAGANLAATATYDSNNGIIIGTNAAATLQRTHGSIIIGYGPLSEYSGGTGTFNRSVVIGYEAGKKVSNGSDNVYIGSLVASVGTAAVLRNVAIGSEALQKAASSYNTAVGMSAGKNATGDGGTYFGAFSGNAGGGARNTSIGYSAGTNISSNTSNESVFVGYMAGQYDSAGSNLTHTAHSVILGHDARPVANQNNQILVGADVVGTGANHTVIGNSSQTQVTFGGNALISGSVASTGSFGRIETAGNLVPKVHNTSNLGSESNRWANIYSADLQLSNMDNDIGNEIDGTKGSWTIQEGSDDLYLLNRKNGKKYKFKLEEIT
tara:strand:- start:11035 stop:15543 length:4509 start_codon:yes stop_codon:yes gene_type:complete